MKRVIVSALMIILLCACAGQENAEENFNEWREQISGVDVSATVTVTQEKLAAQYELGCAYSPEECSVEILSPESLRGVTASQKGEDTQLEYDGLILSLGEIDGVSPVNALQKLVDTIRLGYVELCYTEPSGDAQLLVVQFAPEGDTTVRLWLSEDMVPISADFESDGIAGIKLSINEWNKK